MLTHTLLNLQRSRTPGSTPLEDRTDIALRVEKETDAGIYVHGARVLATLAPLSEEIALYPTTSHQLPGQAPGALCIRLRCGQQHAGPALPVPREL